MNMSAGDKSKTVAWRLRRRRIGLRAITLGFAVLGAARVAQAGPVVQHTLASESAQAQVNVPFTFGQVFRNGDVPAGKTLSATSNGQTVPLQVDVKARNPDGSMRHAVLTARLSSLPGNGNVPLQLATTSPAGNPPPAVSLQQLLATPYNAEATFNLSGTTYSIKARDLLAAAATGATCAQWTPGCNIWLSGPLMTTWVVHGVPKSGSGVSYPHLQVYFEVRAYAGAGGGIGSVRTDIIVENAAAYDAQSVAVPQVQPQYTAVLASGTANFTSAELTQYAFTRWHKVLWWNDVEPEVYVRQDTRYIQTTRAVPRYMALNPPESLLASLRQSCEPLDDCDQTLRMGSGGWQDAIGPLPRWTAMYLVKPDARAWRYMLANTDALGAYSVHYLDQATGWPASIQDHPFVSIGYYPSTSAIAYGPPSQQQQDFLRDLLPTCTDNEIVSDCTTWGDYKTGNPKGWEVAHQPAMSYVPYMVTGDYFYLSELAYSASYNDIWSSPFTRNYTQGYIDPGVPNDRAKAWVLRQIVNAAWLLPDAYPLKAEFNSVANNAIANFNDAYTDNPDASPLHVTNHMAYANNGVTAVAMPPWQHSYLTWAAGHAANLGFADAARFRDWLGVFEISTMTDWVDDPNHGFCWLEASLYSLQVQDANHDWLPNFNAVYATQFPTLSGLSCNSPEWLAEKSRLAGRPWQAGEMDFNAASAQGFPAFEQIGYAILADTDLPRARLAWSIFDSRTVKPTGYQSYDYFPNYAVIPHGDVLFADGFDNL